MNKNPKDKVNKNSKRHGRDGNIAENFQTSDLIERECVCVGLTEHDLEAETRPVAEGRRPSPREAQGRESGSSDAEAESLGQAPGTRDPRRKSP